MINCLGKAELYDKYVFFRISLWHYPAIPSSSHKIGGCFRNFFSLANPLLLILIVIYCKYAIDPGGKRARRTTRDDYKYYDYLIGMDYANAYNMKRIYGGAPDGKISMLLDHCGRSGQEVADPWYTDDFDATWDDVLQGCTALLGILTGKK